MQKLLSVKDLTFRYPDGRLALDGINLSVYRGDTLALIGPNGAGKSTLIQHFNGILLSDGSIELMGRPVNRENLKWVRSRVGLVFQNPDDQLFSPTVFDDVAFGPINMGLARSEVEEMVSAALKMVGLEEFGQRSPHHLSVGEKKRVALATILSMNPEIMVIDEPTTNLDPRGKWSFTELLKSLPATKIIVTHDLEMVAELANRVVILDKGRLIADGPAQEILTRTGLLASHGLARSTS